ncbi:MAG: SAM-dependent methyltransferase [Ginsengibacter sp.]
MSLSKIIIDKIKKEGPISFHDFMEIALYYPSLGYYDAAQNRIGTRGDYYTSPVLSSLFGHMIGRQLEEMWDILGKKPFTIVEFGAGTGALCHDILNYLKNNESLYTDLRYCIIEKSATMRKIERSNLTEKVSWHSSINEISEINGCILSNELLDNFPVHKVIMRDELKEVFVDYQNGFIEALRPANEELSNYLKAQSIVLSKDYTTEINLQAIDWIKEIADNLKSGFVMTIDYGFSASELYNEKRKTGTLTCYKSHETNDNPYSNIGSQDITAHVNFTALNYWGKSYGLGYTGFTTQDYFLRSLGLINYLRQLEMDHTAGNRNLIIQIQKLLMDMGNKFKVLIQQKGVKNNVLTGMQFSFQEP